MDCQDYNVECETCKADVRPMCQQAEQVGWLRSWWDGLMASARGKQGGMRLRPSDLDGLEFMDKRLKLLEAEHRKAVALRVACEETLSGNGDFDAACKRQEAKYEEWCKAVKAVEE